MTPPRKDDLTSKQLRWLAGVLERAPCIDPVHTRIRLSTSYSRELPEALHKLAGGSLHKYASEGARWTLSGFEALALVRTLARYLKLPASKGTVNAFLRAVATRGTA